MEALKQENAHLGGNTARSLDSTGSSGIRRVGRLTIGVKGDNLDFSVLHYLSSNIKYFPSIFLFRFHDIGNVS